MENKNIKLENNINCISENTQSSIVNDQKYSIPESIDQQKNSAQTNNKANAQYNNKANNNNNNNKANNNNNNRTTSDINIGPMKSIIEKSNEESQQKEKTYSQYFNYDELIDRAYSKQEYNPYAWPANIEMAKTHEKASSLGEEVIGLSSDDQANAVCPCCDNVTQKTPYNWKKVNVTETLSEKYGTAVPLLFEIIKYYGLCIFLIFCTNGIYSIYQYKNVCDEHPTSCIKMLGFLPIVGDDTMLKYLDTSSSVIYRWLNFASYVMILVSQILIDLFCDIREKKLETFSSVQMLQCAKARTLLVAGIPKHTTEQQIKQFFIEKASQLSNGRVALDIVDFFFVRDYSKFNDLFQKRTKLYFQCKPLLQLLDDQKTQMKVEKLKRETAEINEKLHDVSNGHLAFKGKAFITLRTHTQARDLKNMFPKTSFRKGYTVFLSMLKKINCFADCIERRQSKIENMLMMQWAPEAKEINWENLGIQNIDKMKLLTISFILSIIAAVASGLCLTYLSKAVPGFYILIFNILIMIFYTVFLEYLANKKKCKTTTSKAYFLMSKQGFFILIYFVLLPVLYYGFSDSDSTGLKTYSLFILFLVNSGFQFLGIIINGKHRAHASFQKKLQKNPHVADKFCQKALHLEMQKPEFELEQRMIGVMQLWTYSTLHAFVCSYTLLFSLLLLAILYYSAKRMLFTQYTIYNYKKLSLQRKFLSTYSVCFQFAVLFMFQIANHTDLQRILAGVFFGVIYIGYLIFSHFRQVTLKNQRVEELLKQPLIENEDKEYKQPSDSYSLLFNNFLKSYEQPFLEEEIQNTLQITNPFYQDVLSSFISQGGNTFHFNRQY